jgi:hypothetical protein
MKGDEMGRGKSESMDQIRNAYNILVRKREGKRPYGTPAQDKAVCTT